MKIANRSRVWIPTPLQDKVTAAGGDLNVLNAVERAMLPAERILTACPGIVVDIDPASDKAIVNRGGHGMVECVLSQLTAAWDGGPSQPEGDL